MPAEEEEKRADEETLPDTPLHAYGDDRQEDVQGDVEDLKSTDPESSQRTDVAEGEEPSDFPEHPKE
jgi:hypothetical protein